ncbi:hypothetical protein CFP56_043952 [Quercus suber]|uniref:Uncharacterized protein n=1 Tax=Quercus suber TaxID=58331 RepID=A0AAW0IQR8_QUESU
MAMRFDSLILSSYLLLLMCDHSNGVREPSEENKQLKMKDLQGNIQLMKHSAVDQVTMNENQMHT